jgi:hypothetical protein
MVILSLAALKWFIAVNAPVFLVSAVTLDMS